MTQAAKLLLAFLALAFVAACGGSGGGSSGDGLSTTILIGEMTVRYLDDGPDDVIELELDPDKPSTTFPDGSDYWVEPDRDSQRTRIRAYLNGEPCECRSDPCGGSEIIVTLQKAYVSSVATSIRVHCENWTWIVAVAPDDQEDKIYAGQVWDTENAWWEATVLNDNNQSVPVDEERLRMEWFEPEPKPDE